MLRLVLVLVLVLVLGAGRRPAAGSLLPYLVQLCGFGTTAAAAGRRHAAAQLCRGLQGSEWGGGAVGGAVVRRRQVSPPWALEGAAIPILRLQGLTQSHSVCPCQRLSSVPLSSILGEKI